MNKVISRIPEVRNELFGFSIISIIIFHFCENAETANSSAVLSAFVKGYDLLIGSAGVEIFLFLSGMGLFYSFSRDPHVMRFYRKRLARILPTYLLFGGAGWLALDVVIRQAGWGRFAWDLSMLSFWTEGVRLVWYIALILALYLLFPLLYRLIDASDVFAVALIAAVCAGCVALYYGAPTVYQHIEIALWRVVMFLIGVWYGKRQRQGRQFVKEWLVFAALGAVFLLLHLLSKYQRGLLWGVFSLRLGKLFYPMIIILLAAAVLLRLKEGRLRRVLRFFGAMSLELYLSHVILRRIMNTLGFSTSFLPYYLLCIAVSFLLSLAVHKLLTRTPKRS